MSMKDQLARLGMIDDKESGSTPSAWERADSSNARGDEQRSGAREPRGESKDGARGSARGSVRGNSRGDSGRGRSDRVGSDRGERRAQSPRPRHTSSAPAPYDLTPEERETKRRELFKRERQPLPATGSQRFYFELRSGVIDFVEVDSKGHDSLSSGQLAIVDNGKGRVVCVNRQAVQELMRIDPHWIPKRL